MNKAAMLDLIKKHLGVTKNTDFAKILGISSQALSNWYSRNTFDAELLYTKCVDVSPEWLLTGKGPMLRSELPAPMGGHDAVLAAKYKEERDACQARIEELLIEKTRLEERLIRFRAAEEGEGLSATSAMQELHSPSVLTGKLKQPQTPKKTQT